MASNVAYGGIADACWTNDCPLAIGVEQLTRGKARGFKRRNNGACRCSRQSTKFDIAILQCAQCTDMDQSLGTASGKSDEDPVHALVPFETPETVQPL